MPRPQSLLTHPPKWRHAPIGLCLAVVLLVQAALDELPPAASAEERLRIRSLTLAAMLAVRELEVLEAPHIAESEDAAMTAMERQMSTLAEHAKAALDELASPTRPVVTAAVERASAAFARFQSVHAELIRLSRLNSNVRSLALSLGEKRNLAANCDSYLRELNERLQNYTTAATR